MTFFRSLSAFVHAVIGDSTGRPRPAPGSTPERIARAFGEGLVRTLPAREIDARAPRIGASVRTADITHEGQRSTVELSTLLWHAMDGPREAHELETARRGPGCEGWTGRTELGAVAWHALGDPDKVVDAEGWRAIEATREARHRERIRS